MATVPQLAAEAKQYLVDQRTIPESDEKVTLGEYTILPNAPEWVLELFEEAQQNTADNWRKHMVYMSLEHFATTPESTHDNSAYVWQPTMKEVLQYISSSAHRGYTAVDVAILMFGYSAKPHGSGILGVYSNVIITEMKETHSRILTYLRKKAGNSHGAGIVLPSNAHRRLHIAKP